MEQPVGSHFTSPIGMIRLEIHALCPAWRLRSESSYIQLWPQNGGIDGNPFLHKPRRVEESSARRARALGGWRDVPAGFQFLNDRSHRSKSYACRGRDVSVRGIQQLWVAEEGKNYPKTGWIGELAGLSIDEVGGPASASDVKMESGRSEINVSGGVGKVQVHVATALRQLRGNVWGGNDERWFGLPWPEGPQLMESFESVDVLDFDRELLRLLRCIDLNQGVGTNRGVPMDLGLPLENTCGEAGFFANGFQDAFEHWSFGTFFWHGRSSIPFIVSLIVHVT
jgi:hypothetical protein